MRYLLRLSGEHPTLPKAELEAVLQGELLEYTIREHGRLAVVDVDGADPAFVSRLAYTTEAAEYLGESKTVDGLAAPVYDGISDAASFRVTAPAQIQKRLGGLLHELGLEVDLKDPDADVIVVEAGGRYMAGVRISQRKDYGGRRAQYRPYFHPTSMHPKLARAMVNLTRVNAGDRILDPFCGTGGILIEAGLMGIECEGWDIDRNMVEGARQNLREYGIKPDIREADATEAKTSTDAIATDPPYGRSSYTSEETGTLYGRFMANARSILDEGCYMALMLPAEKIVGHPGFTTVGTYDVYIHKSLTRRVTVLQAV